MTELRNQIAQTLEFIRTKTDAKPVIGIILGTGLGGFVKEIKKKIVIDYANIPHFPVSTVESHQGKLIFGTLAGKKIVVMQGRFHLYEGYSVKQISYPVRVLKFLGVENILISNAAGALNPLFKKGDVMAISDHINLLGDNPLIGPNDDSLGPRFPDMSDAYSKELIALAEEAALDLKIRLQKGVYVALQGPNLETKAEYRFLRTIGADAVGMSTVPEDIIAVHMGIRVLAFSILTDECFPDALQPTHLEEVLKVATKAEPKMTAIMKEVIKRMKP
ncbi:MAG: purine-nucleoside phosphorylase [Ignavibacteriae bacterium]|nr:MAG: purine-nucleoside phosphorylase [Ignavibacteriota bacterium]